MFGLMRCAVTFSLSLLAGSAPAFAQILDAREVNTAQIQALDRARTAIVLPGGIFEEHGPYLPACLQ